MSLSSRYKGALYVIGYIYIYPKYNVTENVISNVIYNVSVGQAWVKTLYNAFITPKRALETSCA